MQVSSTGIIFRLDEDLLMNIDSLKNLLSILESVYLLVLNICIHSSKHFYYY